MTSREKRRLIEQAEQALFPIPIWARLWRAFVRLLFGWREPEPVSDRRLWAAEVRRAKWRAFKRRLFGDRKEAKRIASLEVQARVAHSQGLGEDT